MPDDEWLESFGRKLEAAQLQVKVSQERARSTLESLGLGVTAADVERARIAAEIRDGVHWRSTGERPEWFRNTNPILDSERVNRCDEPWCPANDHRVLSAASVLLHRAGVARCHDPFCHRCPGSEIERWHASFETSKPRPAPELTTFDHGVLILTDELAPVFWSVVAIVSLPWFLSLIAIGVLFAAHGMRGGRP